MNILTNNKLKTWAKKWLLVLLLLLCIWPLYMLGGLMWIRYSGSAVHLKLKFKLHDSTFEAIVKNMEQQDKAKLLCKYSDFSFIAINNKSYKITDPKQKAATFHRLEEENVNVMQIEELFRLLTKTGCDCIEKYQNYIELSISGFLDKTYGYVYVTKRPSGNQDQYFEKIKKEYERDHHVNGELDISKIKKDWYRFQYNI